MIVSDEVIQRIRHLAESALHKIEADNLQEKVELAVKFVRAQASKEIILNGKTVTAVAVDIATIFSCEGSYRQITGEDGAVRTVETVRALNIVIVDDEVILCKSTYDVWYDASLQKHEFINEYYRTSSVEELTERYIC